jgi:hypothetical protein
VKSIRWLTVLIQLSTVLIWLSTVFIWSSTVSIYGKKEESQKIHAVGLTP